MSNNADERDSGAAGERAPSTTPQRPAWVVWALPAAGLLVGLLVGFAVWGGATDDGEPEEQAQPRPSMTASASSPAGSDPTVTVTIPQECLDAVDASEQALDLLEQATAAISEFDAAELQQIVDQLQDSQERIRELGEDCRDMAVVPSTIPSAAPTS
jgi:hypothetical protein